MKIVVTDNIAACHALRRRVFIDEQGVSVGDEMDDLDGEAIHFLATVDGEPVGTARVLVRDQTATIGRVCVAKSQRGTGLGVALMTATIEWAREAGLSTAKLSSQTQAISFYERLGFRAFGPEYDDAGIPHRDMERRL